MIEELVISIGEDLRIGDYSFSRRIECQFILTIFIWLRFILCFDILCCLLHQEVEDTINIFDSIGSTIDWLENQAEKCIMLEEVNRHLIVVVLGDFLGTTTGCLARNTKHETMRQQGQNLPEIESPFLLTPRLLKCCKHSDKGCYRRALQAIAHRHIERSQIGWNSIQHRQKQILIRKHNGSPERIEISNGLFPT